MKEVKPNASRSVERSFQAEAIKYTYGDFSVSVFIFTADKKRISKDIRFLSVKLNAL